MLSYLNKTVTADLHSRGLGVSAKLRLLSNTLISIGNATHKIGSSGFTQVTKLDLFKLTRRLREWLRFQGTKTRKLTYFSL